MARADAVALEGIDAGIRRAKLYLDAGADAIFPEALNSAETYKRFAGEIGAPLLANMTELGLTPFSSAEQFGSFGFKMVIWRGRVRSNPIFHGCRPGRRSTTSFTITITENSTVALL